MRPWKIVLIVAALTLAAGLVAVRTFVAANALGTFKEFEIDVPWMTRVALHPASTALAIVTMVALVVAGVRAPASDLRGHRWIAAAIGLGLVFGVFFLIGMYAPMLDTR